MSLVVDGNSLRSLRESRGWSQRALAERAAIDSSVVSRLERGLQDDVDASILVRLARALDAPVDALLVPEQQYRGGDLTGELAVAVAMLGRLPAPRQQQVAALLRAYVASEPEEES